MPTPNYNDDTSFLFTLRVPTREGMVVIHAFENSKRSIGQSHTYIDIQVRLNGKDVFKRGCIYCGIPNGTCIDGNTAKEHVLSCVAIKPSDTDPSYFEEYTPEQLDFARSVGEELSMVREWRYCDKNGNVKREK